MLKLCSQISYPSLHIAGGRVWKLMLECGVASGRLCAKESSICSGSGVMRQPCIARCMSPRRGT